LISAESSGVTFGYVFGFDRCGVDIWLSLKNGHQIQQR